MQKCTGNFILNMAKELLGHFKYGDMIRQILRLRSPIKQEFYISVWGRGMVINFVVQEKISDTTGRNSIHTMALVWLVY